MISSVLAGYLRQSKYPFIPLIGCRECLRLFICFRYVNFLRSRQLMGWGGQFIRRVAQFLVALDRNCHFIYHLRLKIRFAWEYALARILPIQFNVWFKLYSICQFYTMLKISFSFIQNGNIMLTSLIINMLILVEY